MTRFYSIVLLLSISLTTVGQSSNYSAELAVQLHDSGLWT